tara:strand:- start:93 stop:290 length:198 start_codon:yes stop_codon:yes gene_type:complete
MGFDFYSFNIINDKKLELKEEKQNKRKEINSIKDLSPKIRKINENKMNRIKSMDNFIKFTWSWTL